MSIEEQLSPLERAERHAYSMLQDFIAVMAIRANNPDADLSPVMDEVRVNLALMRKLLKELE